ncbi:transcriptional repressor [Arcanobacterium haemolyticum]|nr:transcriptional repressor [Arcanobacterium haemolyticum]
MPSPRMTVQRAAIAECIREQSGFVSAQQLHEELSAQGQRIGLATVYRALQAMADDGELDLLRSDGETLYRRCATETHHHHLVCRSCGKTVEVSGEGVEKWAHHVAQQAGFVDVSHTLELVGLCAQCARTDASPSLGE